MHIDVYRSVYIYICQGQVAVNVNSESRSYSKHVSQSCDFVHQFAKPKAEQRFPVGSEMVPPWYRGCKDLTWDLVFLPGLHGVTTPLYQVQFKELFLQMPWVFFALLVCVNQHHI